MSATPGQASIPGNSIIALAQTLVGHRTDWSVRQRDSAAVTAAYLVADLHGREFAIAGLAGAPGTGKSSMAGLVTAVLESQGRESLVLALDDYYLGRRARRELARVHPLLAQRGVPGTHDWDRLVRHLDRLRSGDIAGLRLPRFDKARDDVRDESEFDLVIRQPTVVILEGWAVGAPPQDASALSTPINELEIREDPDGHWRSFVNQQVGRYHRDLSARLDRRWVMTAPGWRAVTDWRWQQERERSAGGAESHLESREAVAAFLGQFERLARHVEDSCEAWADVLIRLDAQHVMRVDLKSAD